MDFSIIFMYLGFILAAYSVVGNDVIQTLGTFLSSNSKRPWVILWIFAGSILVFTLFYGYYHPDLDVTYGRLKSFEIPDKLEWFYILPPIVLLIITRLGIPVSTTFTILTLFSLSKIEGSSISTLLSSLFDFESTFGKMLMKSLNGYGVAFIVGLIIYILITKLVEKKFLEYPIKNKEYKAWTVVQWFTTGYLWYNWLTQDLANIYIYILGSDREIPENVFIISVIILVMMLGFIFYAKGGKIQQVVLSKTNTVDIRSATIIDFIYGLTLFYFKGISEIPMSTTWVFIGLLAGRELGIKLLLEGSISKNTAKIIFTDLFKVFTGLVVSIILVIFIKLIA